jgi:hypothetical protein
MCPQKTPTYILTVVGAETTSIDDQGAELKLKITIDTNVTSETLEVKVKVGVVVVKQPPQYLHSKALPVKQCSVPLHDRPGITPFEASIRVPVPSMLEVRLEAIKFANNTILVKVNKDGSCIKLDFREYLRYKEVPVPW